MVSILEPIQFRKLKPVKVSSKVEPRHCNNRKAPALVKNKIYYVCWGNNIARPCLLKEIGMMTGHGVRQISVLAKAQGSTNSYCSHSLFADEIGNTPEEAVINTVTL